MITGFHCGMLWESHCVLTGVRGQRPGHSLCLFTREGGLWVLHSVVRSVPWACLGPACTPHWAGSGPRHREHSDSVRRFTAGLGKRAQEPPRGAVWECRAAGDAQLLRRQTRPLGRAPFLALGAGLLNRFGKGEVA